MKICKKCVNPVNPLLVQVFAMTGLILDAVSTMEVLCLSSQGLRREPAI